MQDSPTQILYADREPILVLRSTNLRVANGPQQGLCCELGQRRVRVGTASDNDLVIVDAGVSRYHVEIQVHDKGYLIRDLDSTNGTFYRGARVREALLRVSGELRVGGTILRLEPGEERSGAIGQQSAFGHLIGSGKEMQRVYGALAAVAPTEVTVLIEGETGTGKELVAEQLHRKSARAEHLFSVVDCGALPENLIESELFGHEKGAFTGAISERIGVFEKTRGGTIFLDEIGELPLPLQTRLLRVLDRRTIRRIGSNVQRNVDVRIVAATNRHLPDEVKAGRFRQDLLYRLSVVTLQLPALRKRKADIPLLARHFLLQAGAVDPDAILTADLVEVLRNRRWPGNVRELRNVVERALVLTDGVIPPDPEPAVAVEKPPQIGSGAERSGTHRARDGWLAGAIPGGYLDKPYKVVRELVMQQFDTLYLGRLVERHGKNISAIARDAEADRHVIRRLLRKLGLHQ